MSSSALQQLIIERIQREGPLTFAEYMRMALYEPGYGYYVSGPAKMGWEGDYYTSTDVSPMFANCMGRQLYQMWEQLGQPATFTVLEQGAGRGNLSRGVRAWAEQSDPAFHTALDYQSQDIHAGQDALLALQLSAVIFPQYSTEQSERIQQPSTPANQPASALNPSVILSNELVDAFPVHVIEKHDKRLYEIYIAVQDGRLSEILNEPSSDAVANYLDSYKIPWQSFDNGWRAEVNLDALDWMERTAKLLLGPAPRRKRRGFILNIDYGDTARNLYVPQRHNGSLTCYFQHQPTDKPLVRPGEQDLTAHVNFTALIDEARHHGLRLHSLSTQRQWLTEMKMYEELEQIRQRDFAILDTDLASDQGQIALFKWYDLRQRLLALTTPGGMGDFKVLILKR